MRIPNKLVINNLIKNKKQTFTTLISISLACILLFSIGIAFSTFKNNNIKESIAYRGTYHVQFNDIAYKDNYEYLNNDSNIKDIKVFQNHSSIFTNESDEHITLITTPEDLTPYFHLLAGNIPKHDKEIIISSNTASNYQLQIGERIDEFTITGIYNTTILYDKTIKNRFVAYGRYPINPTNEHTTFYVTYKNISESYNLIQENAIMLGIDNHKDPLGSHNHISPNTAILKAYGVTDDDLARIRSELILAVILYVLSLFCILIIYNSFSISLSERKSSFGALRSIGASINHIRILVIKEITILGLISIPASFLLSYSLIYLGVNFINSMIKTSIEVYIYPSFLLLSLLFVLFTIIISAITPARAASKVSPIAALTKQNNMRVKKSKEHYPFIKRVFGTEGEVAYKNIKRNGKKYTSTIISLSISVILFIITSTFINYIISTNEYERDYNYDISIYMTDHEDIINRIKSIKAYQELVLMNSSIRSVSSDNFLTDSTMVNIISLDDKSLREYKHELNITTDEAILYNPSSNNQYINNQSIKICREFSNLDTCFYEFNNLTITDKTYKDLFLMPTIILSERVYNQIYEEYLSANKNNSTDSVVIYINSKKYQKFDNEMQTIIRNYPNVEISYSNTALENHEKIVQYTTMCVIIYSVLGFITIISLTGMLSAINANLNIRETEMSILRSIGFSKKRLARMLKLESVFILVKTLLISIPVSSILILLLRYASSLQSDPTVRVKLIEFPWIYIGISIIITIIITFIATSFIGKKIRKKNIIDSIRSTSV